MSYSIIRSNSCVEQKRTLLPHWNVLTTVSMRISLSISAYKLTFPNDLDLSLLRVEIYPVDICGDSPRRDLTCAYLWEGVLLCKLPCDATEAKPLVKHRIAEGVFKTDSE